MTKPYIWQMIKEAISTLNKRVKYVQIKDFINSQWPGENQNTITAQIIALTVNHNSRRHYPENRKPRLTNPGSKYDLLFSTGRGEVEAYDPIKHGVWEIFLDHQNKLAVRLHKETRVGDKVFSPTDIAWIKNVTNSEVGEAYLDFDENTFVLNFPTHHKGNVEKPHIGDIILIRQVLKGIPVFTHLVSPIDEGVFDENHRPDYRYGRRVKIIAKAGKNNAIPISETSWSAINFSGVSQGNACEIANMKSVVNLDALQLDAWRRFKPFFVEDEQISTVCTDAVIYELESLNPDFVVSEGGLKLVSHFIRERNPQIVKEKKAFALANQLLHCEVCDFSFQSSYGMDFIECHHIVPIAESGITDTTCEDLALVCSNCHRMLHKKFDGKYLSIWELRERVQKFAKES